MVTNDSGTWLLKRPQDFAPAEFLELVSLARKGAFTDLYKRTRIQLSANRTAPPLDPGHNFSINRWSLYAPGTTYSLPIIETTALTINALLELFGEDMGCSCGTSGRGSVPQGLVALPAAGADTCTTNRATSAQRRFK